jgi:hypothetical protein
METVVSGALRGTTTRVAYRSGSFSAYTFRLVWSRMLRILVKHPMSSVFERN